MGKSRWRNVDECVRKASAIETVYARSDSKLDKQEREMVDLALREIERLVGVA